MSLRGATLMAENRKHPEKSFPAGSKKLFESERRFRLLVEGAIDYAIYLLDPNGIGLPRKKWRAFLII